MGGTDARCISDSIPSDSDNPATATLASPPLSSSCNHTVSKTLVAPKTTYHPFRMFRKKCGKKELSMLKRVSRVSHPNIVEFLGTEGDTALLQHALRGDCLKMVGTEEVEWENKKKWCLQVWEALKYLHAEVGLCHCDIRLSNVLLDLKMDAKLCDFGSCQEIGTTAVPITAHSYCPPEGMDREPIVIDRSYDVYSFGMLVYALYTRAEPDADIDSRERLVEALQTKKHPRRMHQITDELQVFIRRCIEIDPRQRWYEEMEDSFGDLDDFFYCL